MCVLIKENKLLYTVPCSRSRNLGNNGNTDRGVQLFHEQRSHLCISATLLPHLTGRREMTLLINISLIDELYNNVNMM